MGYPGIEMYSVMYPEDTSMHFVLMYPMYPIESMLTRTFMMCQMAYVSQGVVSSNHSPKNLWGPKSIQFNPVCAITSICSFSAVFAFCCVTENFSS